MFIVPFMGMRQYNQFMTSDSLEFLHEVSDETGLTVSEIVRRMVDHCSRASVLYVVIPERFSGRIQIGGVR